MKAGKLDYNITANRAKMANFITIFYSKALAHRKSGRKKSEFMTSPFNVKLKAPRFARN